MPTSDSTAKPTLITEQAPADVEHIVAEMERLIERAKAGDILDFAWVYTMRGGATTMNFQSPKRGGHLVLLLGAVETLKSRVLDAVRGRLH